LVGNAGAVPEPRGGLWAYTAEESNRLGKTPWQRARNGMTPIEKRHCLGLILARLPATFMRLHYFFNRREND
jgi:hypothetical protein